MFGVLVVTTDDTPSPSSPLFFLAAYSGTLDIDTGDFFVPAIYDLPKGSIPTDPAASYELQMNIFHQYRLLNARGESKDIIEIFEDYHSDTPTRRFFGTPRDAESRNRHKSYLPRQEQENAVRRNSCNTPISMASDHCAWANSGGEHPRKEKSVTMAGGILHARANADQY